MSEQKVKRYAEFDNGAFEDILAVYAANVENAMILVGAKPSEYTAADCVKIAAPFVLELFKKGGLHIDVEG